ncbi:TetR/AcrR family transcriptional regulator [Actinomycetes bacterium M1A6_2h]
MAVDEGKAGRQTVRPARTKRPPKAGKDNSRVPRLSMDDWIDSAFALLVKDGAAGVKITRLCEELGVTKGSFYWHFEDIDALMAAVADRWCDTQNDTLRGLNQMDSIPLEQRLELMAESLIDESTWAVEVAVRDWARTDEKVAESVRALDNGIFDVVQDSLLEMGFDAVQARLRAGFLVFAGIGFVHARESLPTPTPAEVHAMFTLMTMLP